MIPRELADGWLAVQGTATKIRLAPIPDGWMHLSDQELVQLVARTATAGDGDGAIESRHRTS